LRKQPFSYLSCVTKLTSKTIYLPGLNGLRAIAALAVVISHITLSLGNFGLDNTIFGTDDAGNASGLNLAGYGVTIFFTLSGFLITFLLLKEKETTALKIKAFYIRRALRIWPLYYLYLVVCLITIFLYHIFYNASSLPFYIFLAANVPYILGQSLPFLAHYWSLGVEEQFYLFFPQIARLSNKKLFNISIVLIISLLLLKALFWMLDRRYGISVPYTAIRVTSFHTMLTGVVAAMLYYQQNRLFIVISTNIITQAISWIVLVLLAFNKFHVAASIDSEIVSIVAVFLIMGQITKRNHLVNLENPVCDFIGKISYGVYVMHPLLIFYLSKMIGHFKSATLINYIFVYLLITAVTIFVAWLSYEFYEKKFLKLKLRYTTVNSKNTKNSE
jgi:peptidoglycan/LPS O-acetylase OafA/YrhL